MRQQQLNPAMRAGHVLVGPVDKSADDSRDKDTPLTSGEV